MQTKICTKCNAEKSVDLFYFCKTRFSSQCKECIRLKGKYANGYEKPKNLPNEEWLDVPGFEGLYQASKFGRLKSLERKSWNGFCWHLTPEKILKQSNSGKYLCVGLSKNNKVKLRQTQVWIAMTFLNHIPKGFKIVVDHIDDDKHNNYLTNLQLLTNRENVNKGFSKMNLTSKYTGVRFSKKENRFISHICIKGSRQTYLGRFKEELDAHNTYQTALKNLDKYENDKQFRELVSKLNQKL